jgi:hypothetical protein
VTARTGGTRWRILVHDRLPHRGPDGVLYGTAHSIASHPDLAGEDREHFNPLVFPSTEFDELVVSHWLHIEQMNASLWCIDAGGVMLSVTVDRDGRPRQVTVEGPEDDRHPGCVYRCEWDSE